MLTDTAAVAVNLLLPYGVVGLFALSFLNSSVSPVPTEVLLVPLVLLAPQDVFVLAAVSTIASVLGAVFAYYLGARGRFLRYLVKDKHFRLAQRTIQEHGVVIVGVSGIAPPPFKLLCLAAGFFGLSLWKTVVAAAVSRGARFFAVAYAVAWYGDVAVVFIRENILAASVVVAVVVIAAYLATRRVLSVEVR